MTILLLDRKATDPAVPTWAMPGQRAQGRLSKAPGLRQRLVLDRTEHVGILVPVGNATRAVVRNLCRVSNLLVAEQTVYRCTGQLTTDWTGPTPASLTERLTRGSL
jgi:hypothetical protein